MSQAIPFVAAAVTFAVTGSPTAAQGAFAISSFATGLFGPKPNGPGPGDLKKPQLALGAQIARIYGRTRRPVVNVWTSEFRATEHEQGGKGGPEGPSSYTYSLDVLGVIADGSNVIGITRIWVNGKLVYSSLGSDETIEASDTTDYWEEFEFFGGGPSQVPWAVYEDAVTDASAYRGMATVGFTDLQCGSSKQLPVIEVEAITAGGIGGVTIFDYTGSDQSWVATSESARIIAWGGGGAGSTHLGDDVNAESSGGASGYLETVVTGLTVGETYTVVVGGGGSNSAGSVYGGGGESEQSGGAERYQRGGGGGGRSALSFDGDDLATAAGGGGGGTGEGNGGAGGGDNGQSGFGTASGGGGTQSAGGAGGVPGGSFPVEGTDGSQYQGGSGRAAGGAVDDANNAGGGGGGGYYGGGGGGGSNIASGGGGGGGSSYPPGDSTQGVGVNPGGADSEYYDGNGIGGGPGTAGSPGRLVIVSLAVPETVDLKDIVDAEMSRIPGLESTDWDSDDLAGVPVTGFTAVGPATNTVGQLADAFYFDLIPGAPMRFIRRTSATVGSIPANDTGAGVDEAGKPFAGTKIGNDEELSAVVGFSYPNILQDHDVDYQSGDRLTTDGPDVRRVESNVVMTPSEAKGRALSSTVLTRAAAYTAGFALSDKYAEAEPGDAYAVTSVNGDTYNLRIKRFTYADGVKDCEWELNELTSLVDSADTDEDYQEAIEVTPAGVASWLPIDGPLLRDADNNAGYYGLVKVSDNSRAFWYESADGTNYTESGEYGTNAVFGSVTAVTGTLTEGPLFNESASITVNVGSGTLSSSTRDALLQARTTNAFLIGVDGRWVVGQFRTATLSAPGVYVLTGLLLGEKRTERYVSSITAGDDFALLTTAGTRRLDRAVGQLGAPFYVKAVAIRRAVASVTGESFTNNGVALKPLMPLHLTAERDASTGDATFSWLRCTRFETRFGGDLGDSCPLGEEAEQYRVRVYDDNTYTTVVRDLGTVTTSTVDYSAADQTTDFGSAQATVYLGVSQVSATVGEGYELQDAA